jgi:hypothetical protein
MASAPIAAGTGLLRRFQALLADLEARLESQEALGYIARQSAGLD